MSTEPVFLYCAICANMVHSITYSEKHPIFCCGAPMAVLQANTQEASHEKHIPVIHVNGHEVTIKIGSQAHPMIAEHYIQWIFLYTEKTNQYTLLKPGMNPEASFCIPTDDRVLHVFEYCNIHGLWKISC